MKEIAGKPLDFPDRGGYNVCIPGMKENTFLPQRLSESMRLVQAYEPRKGYRLPTGDGPRPLPRGDKRSALRRQLGWNRGRRKSIFTLVPSFHMTGRAFSYALPQNEHTHAEGEGMRINKEEKA